ncbi:DUF262 domain-containing protein [Flavobacterium sp. GT3P67]|uniref:GmrSD restriction endonuclease domain-containing protein n=1 Tax=Flavobacterium sp. GT3P67 TaxID=2541722 RepID=UPI001042FFDB|nr:DUF262 domain-containing protein [Flavobacterium sp. GT3P67]TDE51435.1 DUF262 domain-containing protein [Flavobacterium sp. GT3P67]
MKTSFWELISNNKIEIPIIQRDYAQGRAEESRIARTFINKLKSRLLSNEKLNLDFVYGKVVDAKLVPLDGQQRLTTLFLLHWYIATKEGQNTPEIKNILANFSYETRPSSQDFCKKIVTDGIAQIDNSKLLSLQIEDQKWFSLSWKSDPTIKAILNMLNIIQEHFSDTDSLVFDKLFGTESLITFNYLPLDKFKLTDELYIKMNSRGKPLTEFENFKANFSYYLEIDEKSKLDNEWYDIFWKLESSKSTLEIKKIDNQFYNFFSNITLNFYVEENDVDKNFLDNFYLFNHYEAVFKDLNQPIKDIKLILDALKSYTDDEVYFNDFIKSTNITYWERLRFYAVTRFFIKQGALSTTNKEIYHNWMRLCRNLINNTLIQSPSEFYTAIRSIKQLSEGLNDIYHHILSKDFVQGFIKNQQEEERLKAELILKPNTDWQNQIEKIENHPYFDGQIGFILNYSKEYGEYSIDKFRNYSLLLSTLFTDYKGNKDYLFQRALTSLGYYIVDISSSKTFCNFETGLRAKADNWRKVFNDDKKNLVLKSLLDQVQFESLENDLKAMIENYSENDWKKTFIDNPKVLDFCSNYQIKKNGEKIYLARSTANNWKRKAELYTYDMYSTHFENKPLAPFNRIVYFETVDEPCIFIENWFYEKHNFALDIYFDEVFSISFYDRYENEYPEEVNNILVEFNFEIRNSRYHLKTTIKDKQDFFNLIHSICKKLEAIKLKSRKEIEQMEL